jgi:hypothetical protein
MVIKTWAQIVDHARGEISTCRRRGAVWAARDEASGETMSRRAEIVGDRTALTVYGRSRSQGAGDSSRTKSCNRCGSGQLKRLRWLRRAVLRVTLRPRARIGCSDVTGRPVDEWGIEG